MGVHVARRRTANDEGIAEMMNQRLAEIYSYYLDERYQDDLSQTFTEWLSTSMYGEELTAIAEREFDEAYKRATDIRLLVDIASDGTTAGGFVAPEDWTPFDDIVAGVDEDTAHGG